MMELEEIFKRLERVIVKDFKWSKDNIYNFYKNKIYDLKLPPEEYEKAIRKLCKIIGYYKPFKERIVL